jgi:type IV pilus assembly protein PilA
MSRKRGFSLIEVMLVLTIIGIVATIAVPSFLQSKVTAREGTAVTTLRAVITANMTYSLTKGYGTYAPDLATLEAVQLIDPALGTGIKGGYTFTIGGGGTGVSTFSIGARPAAYGTSGFRSYYGDESNVIHFTTEDRAANSSDSPL